MSIFAAKCPHCKVDNIAMDIRGGSIPRPTSDSREQKLLGVYLQCTNCDLPISATFVPTHPENVTYTTFSSITNRALSESRDITAHGLRLRNMWPEPQRPRVPDHLEEDASRALLQAERNFEVAGNEEAAGIMYRRALEISLKKAFPGGPDNLSKLIKHLVKEGNLTIAIGEWADHIRELGNEAAHDAGPLNRSDLTAMREFTDAVLRYAISLPREIEKRKAATVPPDGA